MPTLRLRPVRREDVKLFFVQLQDPDAAYMAAFGPAERPNLETFEERWRRLRHDDRVTVRTIELDDQVIGHVACFPRDGQREVTYWLDRAHWGRGYATRALQGLIAEVPERPLVGRVVKDNVASIRVLEKCGFEITGDGRDFASGRGEEVEEYFLQLR